MNSMLDPASRRLRFGRIYDEHFRLVWSVVGQYGLHGALREDAVQEIWLATYRRLHTYRPDASARAWLCSIARKTVWRMQRDARRHNRRLDALAAEPEPVAADPERRLEAADTVNALLDEMSDAHRRVLILSQLHGLTAPEIADGLGVPLNTVYSRLRHARTRVRALAESHAAAESALARYDAPPADESRRTWAALLPRLGTVPAATAIAAGASDGLKAILTTVVLGGAIVGLVAATASPTGQPASEAAVSPPTVGDTTHASTPAPAPIPAPASVAAPVAPEPAPVEASTIAVHRASARGPRRNPVPEPSSPAPSLDDETDLLRRAHEALQRGESRQALELLDAHQARFPDGQLVDVRRGARVRALCGLGRSGEARAEAQRLGDDLPGAVAAAVEDVCNEKAGADDGSSLGRK
jgi:RNA polymerase sigma-70 factor (ECF subfamily)